METLHGIDVSDSYWWLWIHTPENRVSGSEAGAINDTPLTAVIAGCLNISVCVVLIRQCVSPSGKSLYDDKTEL